MRRSSSARFVGWENVFGTTGSNNSCHMKRTVGQKSINGEDYRKDKSVMASR